MIQKFKGIAPKIDDTCYIAPGACVIGDVEIGSWSSVLHNAVIRGDVAKITVGRESNIQDCSVLHCSEDLEIRIGDKVTIGHGVVLHSCTIGDESLIGMGAIVLDGVKIGRNCLIGAGALVTPNTVIPDGMMVLGSPAKVKRELSTEEIASIVSNAGEYVRISGEYIE